MPLSFASYSAVVSRGCSSCATTTDRPSSRESATGTISSASRPAAIARRRAAGCAARTRPGRRARSEFGGDVLRGLGHRVDAILRLHQRVDEAPADRRVLDLRGARERRVRPSRSTKGARVMLSTPPAIISAVSPLLIARAAIAIASRLDPQSRLTVAPATSCGNPPAAATSARRCGCPRRRRSRSRRRRRRARSSRPRVALDQRLHRQRAEIVGADAGQRAAVAAEGRADRVADEGFGHCVLRFSSSVRQRRRAAGRPSGARARRTAGPARCR